MATRKRSEIEQEMMTEANLLKVIRLLEPTDGEKAITKKEACGMLGMVYNTTRLGTLLEEFKAKKVRELERRAALRGKPPTSDETLYIIQEYLVEGSSLSDISKATYRSTALVKQVLETHNVPIRPAAHDYFKPELIPDAAMREKFMLGETVYSARYDSIGTVESEKFTDKHGWVYRVWLLSDKWLQYCYQPASELASLSHLKELGVKF